LDDNGSGGPLTGREQFLGDHAGSTSLHVREPHVGQGDVTSVLGATVLGLAEIASTGVVNRAAELFAVPASGTELGHVRPAIADDLQRARRAVGPPVPVRQLGIPRTELPLAAPMTVKSFNANRVCVSWESSRRKPSIFWKQLGSAMSAS
jgi:hypothetical protein